PDSSNESNVQGRVLLAGKPVSGVRVSIQGWVAAPTDKDGQFVYPVDNTMTGRYIATVADASGARSGGKKLRAAELKDVAPAPAAINVGYRAADLSASKQSDGTILVKGRLTYGDNQAPPVVGLYSYMLQGTITDSSGNPVRGAVVTTRTNDHKFWTFSRPTGA